MLYLIGKIINKGNIDADDAHLEQIYLKLSGLVKDENGVLRYTNRIYQTVFNQAWLDETFGKVDRPFVKDIQRWLKLNKTDSALLKGEVLAKANEWASKRDDLTGIENEYLLLSIKLEQEERLADEKKRSQSKTIKLLIVSLIAVILIGVVAVRNLKLEADKANLELKSKTIALQSEQVKVKLKQKNEQLESLSNYASKDIDLRLNRVEIDEGNKDEEYHHYPIPTEIGDTTIELDKSLLKRFTISDEKVINSNRALIQLILQTKKVDFDKYLWLNTLSFMSPSQKNRLFGILQYSAYCDESKVYIEESDSDKAIELLNSAIEKYPKHSEAYYILGDIYFQLKQYKKSLKIYIGIEPKNTKVENKIAIVYAENYGKENLAKMSIKNEIKNLHRKNNKNP